MGFADTVKPGTKVRLSKHPTDSTGKMSEKDARAITGSYGMELSDLQELLYAAGTHSLLVVLQGMDTSGKDGVVRGVFTHMNPQGVRVASFKVPTPLERAHDYLWRIHKETPERGMAVVFNRSHYECVLVERVKEIAPEPVWKRRYEQINQFEAMLASENTIIMKFFLHISKDEQERRLVAREKDVTKAWKLSATDWIERRNWDAYQQAYEDALTKCSTDVAPWIIVPADHKWYRDLVIAEAVRDRLMPFQREWLETLEERGRLELAAVQAAKLE